MKKKTYQAPKSTIVTVETSIIATSTFDVDISDQETDDDAKMTNSNRQDWGNIWN